MKNKWPKRSQNIIVKKVSTFTSLHPSPDMFCNFKYKNMQELNFKQNVNFESGCIYSVCLRGARVYDKKKYLLIHTNKNCNKSEILSFKHFRFKDLKIIDISDNYDKKSRTINGIISSMLSIYPDFDNREIITILKFKII